MSDRAISRDSGPSDVAPSVQGWVLPHLVAYVEEQGVDPSSIRQLFGATNLCDPDIRIAESIADEAWRLAAALTANEALGIHVAKSLPRGALDLVEFALRSSASLGKGLERLARYGRVISDRVAVRTHSSANGQLLLVRDTAMTELHHARAEFALAITLELARDCTGTEIVPLHVSFAHPAPPDSSAHRRFFGCDVRFAAGSTAMTLSAADAGRRLREADPDLEGIIRRRLDSALAQRDRCGWGETGARLRRLLVETLGRTAVTPDGAASALAVSRRTLARRLAEEGTSFRRVLDDVRKDFACALLRDPAVSIGDVGFFLQFSDSASFHRAFRRWTGHPPGALRHD